MKPGWHPKTFVVADTNVGGCLHLRQYLVLSPGTMTVLEALAISKSAPGRRLRIFYCAVFCPCEAGETLQNSARTQLHCLSFA